MEGSSKSQLWKSITSCSAQFDNRPPGYQQKVQQMPPTQNSGTSLEDLVKAFSTNTIQFQQETKASIRNLEAQMGQMAAILSQIQARDSRKVPSQTIVNPRENVNTMTLRSGKQLETPQKDNAQKEDNTIASSSHPNDVSNCKCTILSSNIKDYRSHRDVNNKQTLEL